jgi:hypothetical protein
MKTKISCGLVFISLLALSGCVVDGGRPPACAQKETCQRTLRSVQNWAAISDGIAEHVAITSLSLKRSIFISSSDNSEFAQTFASLLRSSLVQKGVPVSVSANDSLRLNFSVQSVKPMVVRHGFYGSSGLSKRGNLEVILTVSIAEGGSYILHSTQAYYVDQTDEAIFESILPPRSIRVIGSSK